ncbi:hypothetical protein IFM89_023956 [Coptis chinensis]|uniref:Calcineurin-like phosphoesterase domain-containing protein n=1 Tax=Coptis chinensis TaxID=261450 RepID=A0A835HP47_9MAGN|nr:hypothetical protein IFM89_023956 [Coptis chinensis]
MDSITKLSLHFSFLLLLLAVLVISAASATSKSAAPPPLNFGKNGEFKILQVADMHYANGKTTPCEDVLPDQFPTCSDFNTTAFINRLILAENPDLIVFTGDNIFGLDTSDAKKSLNFAFAPAVETSVPWAAVLGNHDQESTLSREGLMKHIVTMNHTLSQVNPLEAHVIDGFGNYNLEVGGVKGSRIENMSVLNLYFWIVVTIPWVPSIPGYDWIKPSQQFWFQKTSLKLKKAYMEKQKAQTGSAPGLVYFHIPLPEYASLHSTNFTGVKLEAGISSASINSGFFATLLEAGDVKAVFTGHDHLNDFCGELNGIQLCYAGGFGYHAYGKAGWDRRARVVVATLEQTDKKGWGAVKSIRTWKRLDDQNLTTIDPQLLWLKKLSCKCLETWEKEKKMMEFLLSFLLFGNLVSFAATAKPKAAAAPSLHFSKNGDFKILQVADMHYGNGKTTQCEDVLPDQFPTCSDLNTTAFVRRMILAESPDLIVFTGDNIFGFDATDAEKSLDSAFAPAIESGLPWVAVLGNHDQESTLSREGVMKHIVTMNGTLARLNPLEAQVIDGFGNYNLEVGGVEGSRFENKSVLNLYFLDSGDYSTVPSIPGYGWIKPSQQFWFQQTSLKLKAPPSLVKSVGVVVNLPRNRIRWLKPEAQTGSAPGLVYFHIPLPEFASFDSTNFTGVKQEGISSPSINSGFFTTMLEAGDTKAVFIGHDHVNDFCGKLTGIHLCYAGGFGYHAYGQAGWDRRARVVLATLEKTETKGWGTVKSIRTWKRLDDEHLTTIDPQVLWTKSSAGKLLSIISLSVDHLKD